MLASNLLMLMMVMRSGIGDIFFPIVGMERRCVDGLALFEQVVVILVPHRGARLGTPVKGDHIYVIFPALFIKIT